MENKSTAIALTMNKEHFYKLTVQWTGNTGNGTLNYRTYERTHTVSADSKETILASADPAFRGDKTKYNPEELLLASLSGCHMLWFLHLCAENGVIVTDYTDNPTGIMEETDNGGGKFKEVTLNPIVTVTNLNTLSKLDDLHKKANELCFIANSVNFIVKHNPTGKTI
ncbi:MAG: OsmC family protein [Paludibacter sp.]